MSFLLLGLWLTLNRWILCVMQEIWSRKDSLMKQWVLIGCCHVQTDLLIIFILPCHIFLCLFFQIHYCEDLIVQAMEGLSYYHTYDRVFLGSSVVLGFIGWTSYVVLFILKTHASLRKPPTNMHMVSERCCSVQHVCRSKALPVMLRLGVYWLKTKVISCMFVSVVFKVTERSLGQMFLCIGLLVALFLLVQSSPWTYYIYCLLPVPVWFSVIRE